MKLKKGSKEAKAFMAKIRGKKKTAAKKSAVKKVATKKKSIKKKISGDKHQDIKSHNYKISISGMKTDILNKLEDLNKKIERYSEMAKFYSSAEKTKGLMTDDKKHYKYMADTSKKHIKSFKDQIKLLKKLI